MRWQKLNNYSSVASAIGSSESRKVLGRHTGDSYPITEPHMPPSKKGDFHCSFGEESFSRHDCNKNISLKQPSYERILSVPCR